MPKIEEIWAWVSEDDGPDDEGIIAHMVENTWLPLVGADKERMESYRPLAEAAAAASGKKVKLLRFSERTLMDDA